MESMLASVERDRSVSSIRRMNWPPWWRAKSQLKRAVRAPPTCRWPVGLGAKRTRTDPVMRAAPDTASSAECTEFFMPQMIHDLTLSTRPRDQRAESPTKVAHPITTRGRGAPRVPRGATSVWGAMGGARSPPSQIDNQDHRHHPADAVDEERPVVQEQLRRIAAQLPPIEQVQVAEDPVQHEGQGGGHQLRVELRHRLR